VNPLEGYPPEVVADIVRVLERIEAHPNGKWADMGELLAVYKRWRDIIRGTPPLLDNSGTMKTVPGLSSFGRIFLLEYRRKSGAEGVAPSASQTPTPQTPPRLIVNLANKTITLDGQIYDVRSENALRWVKVLADHAGEWISSTKLREYDEELDGVRTDKLTLPDAIAKLIESQRGAGSRVRF
jgi:hypothetical protein